MSHPAGPGDTPAVAGTLPPPSRPLAGPPTPVRQAVRATPPSPGRRSPLPGTDDLYGRDEYASALLASLMRAQLSITLSVIVPAFAVVALYPLLCVLFPAVATARVGPVPLSLVLLGGGIYPPLVALGFWYVGRARRAEERFVDLLRDR